MSSQGGGGGSSVNNDVAIVADYNFANEINIIAGDGNLSRVKTSVVNLEKMLIQKKLKLD